MNVFITKNGQRLGPYSIDEASRLRASGQLQDKDWAWYEGLTDWIPLDQVPGLASVPATLPPPPGSLPGGPVSGQDDPTLLIRRLATAAVIFGVLFLVFFLVIFMVALMVGGGLAGMHASMAQHAQPGNFQEGYQIGQEAGREFGAKYGRLIAGFAALAALLLSALAAGWMAFSNLLPWCRRK